MSMNPKRLLLVGDNTVVTHFMHYSARQLTGHSAVVFIFIGQEEQAVEAYRLISGKVFGKRRFFDQLNENSHDKISDYGVCFFWTERGVREWIDSIGKVLAQSESGLLGFIDAGHIEMSFIVDLFSQEDDNMDSVDLLCYMNTDISEFFARGDYVKPFKTVSRIFSYYELEEDYKRRIEE